MKKALPLLLLALLLSSSCSKPVSTALSLGTVPQSDFRDTVSAEVKNRLIILPVRIRGKSYRFLFDTGAPTSISKEIQEEFNFKRVSRGRIVDSDGNRSGVDFVEVDSIKIGQSIFSAQTAFVADFKANPILDCLDLDGIVGSNLMRFCNWVVDYHSDELILSSYLTESDTAGTLKWPFRTNMQYDLKVELAVGKARLDNVEIDYGSNGSLLLPTETFNILKDQGIIVHTSKKSGKQSGGIVGAEVEVNDETTHSDSVNIAGMYLENVVINSGVKGLIGHDILSRYTIVINWQQMLIHLKPNSFLPHGETFGVGLWPSPEGDHLTIQYILENSPAFEAGLKPGMKVYGIDNITFGPENGFCDYVDLMHLNPETQTLHLADENGQIRTVLLERSLLKMP